MMSASGELLVYLNPDSRCTYVYPEVLQYRAKRMALSELDRGRFLFPARAV